MPRKANPKKEPKTEKKPRAPRKPRAKKPAILEDILPVPQVIVEVPKPTVSQPVSTPFIDRMRHRIKKWWQDHWA